jgi:hypothetical protein
VNTGSKRRGAGTVPLLSGRGGGTTVWVMRYALAFLLVFPAPTSAWEMTLGPVCTLHTETAQVELTYDPAAPLYSITVTRKDAP